MSDVSRDPVHAREQHTRLDGQYERPILVHVILKFLELRRIRGMDCSAATPAFFHRLRLPGSCCSPVTAGGSWREMRIPQLFTMATQIALDL